MRSQTTSPWPVRVSLAIITWLDNRYQLGKLSQALLHVHIPRKAKTFYLGGITLFLFIEQVITGALLVLYYQPTPADAYDSVLFIMSNVQFGWLVRSMHAWGANLMVVFCILHLLRIYFQGVYKPPREMTWGVGVALLGITLMFGFTGYLLPWDQRAFWATTVGSEIAGAVPGIGAWLLRVIRSGTEITEHTLSRFFGVHVLFLPLSLALLLGIHLTMIHQQGIANPKKPARPPASPSDLEREQKEEPALPFYPHYVLSEAIAWYIILGILIILASLFPAGLEEKADPLVTPQHIKPEWYFLAVYQFLKLVPRTVGVTLPMAGLLVLLLLPWLDRNPEVQPRKRPFAITMGVLGLIALIAFTVWGHFS